MSPEEREASWHRRHAILRALETGETLRSIATHIGISFASVGKMAQQAKSERAKGRLSPLERGLQFSLGALHLALKAKARRDTINERKDQMRAKRAAILNRIMLARDQEPMEAIDMHSERNRSRQDSRGQRTIEGAKQALAFAKGERVHRNIGTRSGDNPGTS